VLVHLCINDDLMSAMDEYLDGLPREQTATLARVRAVVRELEPQAATEPSDEDRLGRC
jgi:hypothetical protein